ncbi:MAG: hypothetical protein V2I43_13805 [Parvularcula sp.]|nr:hypothetical protein [Parvularcula sp.]
MASAADFARFGFALAFAAASLGAAAHAGGPTATLCLGDGRVLRIPFRSGGEAPGGHDDPLAACHLLMLCDRGRSQPDRGRPAD